MRRTEDRNGVEHRLEEVVTGYAAMRTRVDNANRRMQEVEAAPHAPADARAASRELDTALREAATVVAHALKHSGSGASVPRHRLRRHKATRTAAPDVAAWSAELLRLSQMGVWLRRATLDDLGVHVPSAVRVGCRAANGPHIAGMTADPDDVVTATLHEPRIGVDLQHTLGG